MARRTASNTLIRSNRGPMPNVYRTHMRYVGIITLNAGSSATSIHAFRANSINDPDYSGTGHQPYAHDQLAALYTKYLVTGAKMTCTAITGATTGATANQIVFAHSGPFATVSDIEGVLEQPDAEMSVLGTVTGGQPNCTLSRTYSAKGTHNLKDVYDEEGLQAVFGADPSLPAFFIVGTAPTNFGVDDPAPIEVMVVIDYAVSCMQPKILGSS